jgi:hypothetical protein
VKLPPVVAESVTATLVAFTWSASAKEPLAIVKVVAGAVSEIVVGALYVRGAAWTRDGSTRTLTNAIRIRQSPK